MLDIFSAWQQETEKLKASEITKKEYDTRRYNYPRIEAGRFKAELDTQRAKKEEQKRRANIKNVRQNRFVLSDIFMSMIYAF